ncbi:MULTISPECIES: SAM-dependent methyltransferase [Frankia]|uniref:Methyltransferase n=1 Tax=Frankia alni (strain DSM 45986 / CECT 9034 / ACN14a) TaxID=326424 RepID=Q0RLL7_FRAAA|nr:conserved hypothetical protein [Frankia alni ACN14a]
MTSVPARPGLDLDLDQPHSARMYDYLLGGKDNFPADREAAGQALSVFPNLRTGARANRAFMTRATRYLAGEVGIRQFLDVGTGIPTSPNLHEIAQAIAPESRVVYTDNDPIVLAHARALLTSSPQGHTAYLDADVRDTDRILTSPELRDTLDLDRPVALSLIAVLHFLGDEEAGATVASLIEALPSGSYLALSHATGEFDDDAERAALSYRTQGILMLLRRHDEVARFFDGLDLVDPGVALVHRWRPASDVPADLTDAQVSVYGGIARKP